MNTIQELDKFEDNRPLSAAERTLKIQSKSEVEKVLLLEEISWRQKSKVLWLRERNKNTRFFQTVANSHRRFNTINRLIVNGAETNDQKVIGEGLVSFCSQLFSDDEVRRPLLDALDFSSIDDTDSLILKAPFTEEEVVGGGKRHV